MIKPRFKPVFKWGIFPLVILLLHSFDENTVPSSRAINKDYFICPVEILPSLSGNFGELRSTHFHAGIDFRTEGREGLNILAAANGYVSRVRMSPGGYGNSMYIAHPNGLTTVYAHLLSFRDDIAAHVKTRQYAQRTFEIDLYPEPGKFRVRQGEIIGLSGNSGSSGGPHLHFEIRHSATQVPLNPLFFNLSVTDTRAPVINAARFYAMDPASYLKIHQGNSISTVTQYRPVTVKARKVQNGYLLQNIHKIEAHGNIGIAFETIDYHDHSELPLRSIYCQELQMNNRKIYLHKVDSFSFDEIRFVNSHVDHEKKLLSRRNFQKTFLEPGNLLSIYQHVPNRGIITIFPDSIHEFSYLAEDEHGNRSTLHFTIHGRAGDTSIAPPLIPYHTVLKWDTENSWSDDEIDLYFPEAVLYDNVNFRYEKAPKPANGFSALHRVHDIYTPLHRHFRLTISASQLPVHLQPKALVVRRDNDGKLHAEGGQFSEGRLTARSRSFGDFFVTVDTIPPVIAALNLRPGANISSVSRIRFRVSDDLSGIVSYNGFINSQWVLVAWDPKNNLMYHDVEPSLPKGEHEFRLEVTDERGNKSVIEIPFVK